MSFLRSAISEVVGLFVGDWFQSVTSVVILAVGWLALTRFHVAGLAFAMALALAVQLVLATSAEARRKKA